LSFFRFVFVIINQTKHFYLQEQNFILEQHHFTIIILFKMNGLNKIDLSRKRWKNLNSSLNETDLNLEYNHNDVQLFLLSNIDITDIFFNILLYFIIKNFNVLKKQIV
jgi:hypothetical protein